MFSREQTGGIEGLSWRGPEKWRSDGFKLLAFGCPEGGGQ
jgi:hypothetical protein